VGGSRGAAIIYLGTPFVIVAFVGVGSPASPLRRAARLGRSRRSSPPDVGIPPWVSWFYGGKPTEEHLMGTVELTEATFNDTLAANDIVLVDWWASWCGPCRMFAPIFEAAAAEHEDIVFAKVDTEANRGLAAAANIMSIPTLMVFRDQILVFSQPGALPAAALEDLIAQVRALDMEAVRQTVGAQADATG
jgi:thioredoxin 1